MPRFRLMHVVDSLEFGGLERVVTDLAIAQRQRGHEVAVFSINDTTGFAAELEDNGVPVFMGHKQGTLDLAVLRRMRQQVRERSLQFMHAHNFVPNYYAATALLGLAGHCALVGTAHDMGMRLGQRKLRWMYKASLMRTARVAMVGRQVHDRFVGGGIIDAKRAVTVLNGIPVARFRNSPERRAAAREAVGLPPDALIIGAVGRLVALKNHRQLVHSMAELDAQFPQAHLVIIGAGPLEADLRELASHSPASARIHLLGQRSDVARLTAGFDIYAQPSLTEGLSIALLEAGAAALPVVASAVGGNVEIIDDGTTGLLVPVQDQAALTTALADLLADGTLRQRLGAAAQAWVAANASVESMCDAYDRFYAASLPRQAQALPSSARQ